MFDKIINELLSAQLNLSEFIAWLENNNCDNVQLQKCSPVAFSVYFLNHLHEQLQLTNNPATLLEHPPPPGLLDDSILLLSPTKDELSPPVYQRRPSYASVSSSISVKKIENPADESACPSAVTHSFQLRVYASIYCTLLQQRYVPNINREIIFLLTCLRNIAKVVNIPFNSVHNVVQFVCICLTEMKELLVALLGHNLARNVSKMQYVRLFAPALTGFLSKVPSLGTVSQAQEMYTSYVTFNAELDDRSHFTSARAFHAFRKQRDLFCEMLKEWQNRQADHDNINDFVAVFGFRMRSIVSTGAVDCYNWAHFARLFKDHLLIDRRDAGRHSQRSVPTTPDVAADVRKRNESFFERVDTNKLKRLADRLRPVNNRPVSTARPVRAPNNRLRTGPNGTVAANGDTYETFPQLARDLPPDFFRYFIWTIGHHAFYEHLKSVLIADIVGLMRWHRDGMDQSTAIAAPLTTDTSKLTNEVDIDTRRQYESRLQALCTLAQYLALVESMPYASNYNEAMPDSIVKTNLAVRNLSVPQFDVKTLLMDAIQWHNLVLCIPWVCVYLSRLDHMTVRLSYYTSIMMLLNTIYRQIQCTSASSTALILSCLGALFEATRHQQEFFGVLQQQCQQSMSELQHNQKDEPRRMGLDDLVGLVGDDVLLTHCATVAEMHNILQEMLRRENHSSALDSGSSMAQTPVQRHITPIQLTDSKTLEQKRINAQLEHAFMLGQPSSVRQTVDLVSERIASACVKHMCAELVPAIRDQSVTEFRYYWSELRDPTLSQLEDRLYDDVSRCKKGLLNEHGVVRTVVQERSLGAMAALSAIQMRSEVRSALSALATRHALKRITDWVDSHVTTAIFRKEYEAIVAETDIAKQANDASLNLKDSTSTDVSRPKFQLPPDGLEGRVHNPSSLSGFTLLIRLQEMLQNLLEERRITFDEIQSLLAHSIRTLTERNDINECVTVTAYNLVMDMVFAMSDTEHINNQTIRVQLARIMTIYKNLTEGRNFLSDDMFRARNFMILQLRHKSNTAWQNFVDFCIYLVENGTLDPNQMLEECSAVCHSMSEDLQLNVAHNLARLRSACARLQNNTPTEALRDCLSQPVTD